MIKCIIEALKQASFWILAIILIPIALFFILWPPFIPIIIIFVLITGSKESDPCEGV